jgi:hypothetical protein
MKSKGTKRMRLLILLFAASLSFAQDKPADTKAAEQTNEPKQAEIIQVKTLTGDSFDRLIKLLGVFDARLTADSQMRTIVVYAPKDVVDQIRHVVEQLDKPGSEAAIGKNIDMTLTLLRCSTKPATTASTLPPDMEAVAKQLRAATQYKDIQLWDVVPMRLQEGRDTHEDLRLPGGTGAQIPIGNIVIHPEAVYRKDQARYVRFSHVNLGIRMPYGTGTNPTQFTYVSIGLNTSGDFQEGQKTVLGKVSGTEEGDAIFAVIALKVLD